MNIWDVVFVFVILAIIYVIVGCRHDDDYNYGVGVGYFSAAFVLALNIIIFGR